MVAPERRLRTGNPGGQPLILLVDRRALFLAALSKVIEDSRDARVETTTSSERALEILAEQQVDLVICELRSEPIPGPELMIRAAQVNANTRGILLADPEDAGPLVAAVNNGAAGFFTKDAVPEDFLEGIDAVLAGYFVVGRNLVRTALDRPFEPATKAHSGLEHLSPAEKGILVEIGRGKSTREIAANRSITEKTVQNQLTKIYRKLSLRNRAEAILLSVRMGLTDGSPAEMD